MHICAYLYSYIYIQAKEAAAAAAAEENKKTQENAADAEVKGKESFQETAYVLVRLDFLLSRAVPRDTDAVSATGVASK